MGNSFDISILEKQMNGLVDYAKNMLESQGKEMDPKQKADADKMLKEAKSDLNDKVKELNRLMKGGK